MSKNLLKSMQTMQSEGKHKAKELYSCKEMIATSGNDRLVKMDTSWRDWWWFDLTVFENSSKFSLVFSPAFYGGGGGGCFIRIPLTSTRTFFSYLVQESSLAARLSPSDSLQQSLVMDGNRTAKRRTSKAVQKDKEMSVNFLAALCKRKINTRTI